MLVVAGTRPEIIKLVPVMQALAGAGGLPARFCHSGQHENLGQSVLDAAGIEPHERLMRPIGPDIGALVAGLTTSIGGALDRRAARIKEELDEARRLREEAQSLLASYERKQKEVEGQVQDIVAHARTEAEQAAVQAKKDLEVSIQRRLRAAEEQIQSAEDGAVRAVRNEAIRVAVAAAGDAIRGSMTPEKQAALTDQGIRTVATKLH